MLLTIASGNSNLVLSESNPSNAAQGQNRFVGTGGRNSTASVAEQAQSLFFEGGGRPVSIDRGGTYGGGQKGVASDMKIIYSGRHEGLAFYFARLVRPIWKSKITLLSYALTLLCLSLEIDTDVKLL